MSRSLIQGLQVFRGAAALAVVVQHAAVSTDAFVERIPAAWLRLFSLGAYGVDFFFVLSGFIIMHAHMDEAGKPVYIAPYLFKRLTRIFPAYWPIGLALLGLYAVLPNQSASGGREFSYLSSVLLIPAEEPPALSVAWTLVHELMFYVLFTLWFVSRRAFWSALVAWIIAIVVAQAMGGATGWLRYPLSLLNVEFMLGVFAAMAYGQGRFRSHARTMVAGGGMLACVMLAAFHQGLTSPAARLALAFGLGVMMLGLANRERQRSIPWPPLLLALGNASYSIYLFHNPLLSLTQRVAGRGDMSWPAGLFWGVTASAVCGYLYFLWIEHPALEAARSWRRRERAVSV